MFVPNTWSRCSNILGPETASPQMPRIGMAVCWWLDYTVSWNRTPLHVSLDLPHNPGWWHWMERKSRHPSATAHFVTIRCKITLLSTITFVCTCICPCSVPLTGVFTWNMAAMICGFMLAGNTVYPLPTRQCHHQGNLKSQRSESPIECLQHSASELNTFSQIHLVDVLSRSAILLQLFQTQGRSDVLQY